MGFVLVILCGMEGAAQNRSQVPAGAANGKVIAYYFHFKIRCETCLKVESEVGKDLQELYSGAVNFKVVNLDDASGKATADSLKVAGQTLLVTRGANRLNLTSEGFLYAVTNPAKLKSVIKKKVDNLIALP